MHLLADPSILGDPNSGPPEHQPFFHHETVVVLIQVARTLTIGWG
jgi:hypothetical protein